jgi:hypothetical protein
VRCPGGVDGEFFFAVQDPVAGVADDDGDERAGSELCDGLVVDHDPAAGVDLAAGGDRPGEQWRRVQWRGGDPGSGQPGGAFGGDGQGQVPARAPSAVARIRCPSSRPTSRCCAHVTSPSPLWPGEYSCLQDGSASQRRHTGKGHSTTRLSRTTAVLDGRDV